MIGYFRDEKHQPNKSEKRITCSIQNSNLLTPLNLLLQRLLLQFLLKEMA